MIDKKVVQSGLPAAMVSSIDKAIGLIDRKDCNGARIVLGATKAALEVGMQEAKRKNKSSRWAGD